MADVTVQSRSAPSEPTTVEKLRGLRWSIASNAANTVFVQFTFFGSIFVLFLNALGLSKTQMGFVLSLVPFFGLIALFVAPATARWGYKRTYVTFFGARDLIAGFLLLTPWVQMRYGSQATLTFVSVVIAIFSMVRAVGVTASFPWVQEYVPNQVRGKYTATNNMVATIVGFIAVSVGGFVLARTEGLNGFLLLIAVAVVFGLVSVVLASFIPGGAPQRPREGEAPQRYDLLGAVRDGDFTRYLSGVGLLTLVTVPLGSFLPLFMREQVGLSASDVVWLQTGTLVGSMASSFLWGWAADRYGSIPVTLYGLTLRSVLPVVWMLMPRDPEIGFPIAITTAFFMGVADMGWGIGSGRLLYVNIVPPAKRTDYMAVYYASTGVIGGVSQLVGGSLLDFSERISGQLWVFTLDPFLPLFLAGIAFPLIASVLIRRVREDKKLSMGEFAGIFLRGNPFLAMTSMIRYHLARDEHETILMTERLGQAKSPLTVDELLEALNDPRFNVRFEAIISISRMMPDSRLTHALVEILNGTELALTVVAAWALGRMGEREAIPEVRRALDSPYRSVRAHAARALGALDDREVAPLLLERLEKEEDKGLQMAYASALGNLQFGAAARLLLHQLYETQNEGARMELALTVGRLIGDEHTFVQLLRSVRGDPGTAMSQALTAFRRKLGRKMARELSSTIGECADQLARSNLDAGAVLLATLIKQLPADHFSEAGHEILMECARRFEEFGAQHIEYIILALHTLRVDWK